MSSLGGAARAHAVRGFCDLMANPDPPIRGIGLVYLALPEFENEKP